jgi:uncharacterized membrane protein YcaP (DUF421 family)
VELVLRASAIYWFLWLVVRGTGKRSLAELSPLDFLLVVVMGDLVQQGVTSEDMSVTGAMVVIATFIVWTLLMDALTRRRRAAARVLDGEPVIVLRNGSPVMARLDQERLTIDDLYGAAREQGFARLADIDVGVLENDGSFSFIARQRPNPGTTSGRDRDG